MDSVVSWVVLVIIAVCVCVWIANKLDVKEQKKETRCNTYNRIDWK